MNFLNIVPKTPIVKSKNENHMEIIKSLKWKDVKIPKRNRIEKDIKRTKSLSWLEKPKYDLISQDDMSFSSEIFFNKNYMESNGFDLNFNEIEMSSNAYFKKPIVVDHIDSEVKIQTYKRFYYDFGSVSFNINDSQFSSIEIKDSSELNTKLVVRFDVYDDICLNTNKIVFQTKKFNVKNIEVKLKTCFETFPIELKFDNFSSATKCYDIRKWSVILKLKEMEYKFVVAFRLTEYDISVLNIECEDSISLEDFFTCFEALYVYYNYQYLFNNNKICPENPEFEKFRLSICFENLSECQQLMLENIEFVNESTNYLGLNECNEEKLALLNKAQKYFMFYALKVFFEKKPNLTELLLNKNLFDGMNFDSKNDNIHKFELEELELENEMDELENELLDENDSEDESELLSYMSKKELIKTDNKLVDQNDSKDDEIKSCVFKKDLVEAEYDAYKFEDEDHNIKPNDRNSKDDEFNEI